MEKKIDNPITHFSISGLFGKFDYELDIPTETDWNIAFLTGPNGYGKTTILRIMQQMLVGRKYWPLEWGRIDFTKAKITFQNGDTITATPDSNSVRFYDADGGNKTNQLPLRCCLCYPISNSHALFDILNPDDPLFDILEKEFHINSEVKNRLFAASPGETNLINLLDTLTNDDLSISYLLIDSIDEGMHVAWQNELKRMIKKYRPETQVIYATHSPSVIGGCWERCIDLWEVSIQH